MNELASELAAPRFQPSVCPELRRGHTGSPPPAAARHLQVRPQVTHWTQTIHIQACLLHKQPPNHCHFLWALRYCRPAPAFLGTHLRHLDSGSNFSYLHSKVPSGDGIEEINLASPSMGLQSTERQGPVFHHPYILLPCWEPSRCSIKMNELVNYSIISSSPE